MLFRRRTEHSGKLRIVILIALFLSGGFVFFRYYVSSQLEKGNMALAGGDLTRAEVYYRKVSKLPLSKGRGNDGLGTIALLQGRIEDAKKHFQIVLANDTSTAQTCVDAALSQFISKGAYSEGDMFVDFFSQWQGENLKKYNIDFAVISLGNFEMAKARRFLSNALESDKQTNRYKRILELADQYELNEEIPIVLDRKGEGILAYNLIDNQYKYVTPQLFSGWPGEEAFHNSASIKKDWHNRIYSTIDMDLQRVAHQSLKGYEGCMILMDPNNGDVLAAYGTEGLSPFTTTFEPGSVIKVLTYASLVESGGNEELYAPKKYPGNMTVDGKLFYDWKTHGQLNSIAEGMAVSCNLMFAQMGIDMGWATIRKMLNRFFDRQSHEILFGEMDYGEILKTPQSDYELGKISIGLEELRASVFGLAQIPASICGQGMLSEPRFLLKCNNLLGETYRTGPEPKAHKVFQTSTAKSLLDAMKAAVSFKDGTARRAYVEGIASAMKTGTAGERPFNSVMIGILNPNAPKLVFALYLYKGGKCEINGAAVAAKLQSQIKVIAPQYLN